MFECLAPAGGAVEEVGEALGYSSSWLMEHISFKVEL